MKDLKPVVALTSGSALVRLRLDSEPRRAILDIECLRRAPTGEALVDTPVELCLARLRAFSSISGEPSDSWDPSWLESRGEVVFDRVDVEVGLDGPDGLAHPSPQANRHWHVGNLEVAAQATHRLSVRILSSDPVHLLFAFDELAIASGGSELSVDAWARQHAAWWHGWDERWQSRPPG